MRVTTATPEATRERSKSARGRSQMPSQCAARCAAPHSGWPLACENYRRSRRLAGGNGFSRCGRPKLSGVDARSAGAKLMAWILNNPASSVRSITARARRRLRPFFDRVFVAVEVEITRAPASASARPSVWPTSTACMRPEAALCRSGYRQRRDGRTRAVASRWSVAQSAIRGMIFSQDPDWMPFGFMAAMFGWCGILRC